MPMKTFLANSGFDPEAVAVLTSAFDVAWQALLRLESPLSAPSFADDTRERLAKQIILLGQQGERDKDRLVKLSLAALGYTWPDGKPQPPE